MKRIHLHIDDETLKELDSLARARGLSRSELIRMIVRQWLREKGATSGPEDRIIMSAVRKIREDLETALSEGADPRADPRFVVWLEAVRAILGATVGSLVGDVATLVRMLREIVPRGGKLK